MENKMTLLDKLWVICEHAGYSDIPYEFCKNDHIYEKEIKEALIEYEKQTQILEVLKNKKVDIEDLFYDIEIACDVVEALKYYNINKISERKLTLNEFNLIKEWLNNGKC